MTQGTELRAALRAAGGEDLERKLDELTAAFDTRQRALAGEGPVERSRDRFVWTACELVGAWDHLTGEDETR